MASIFRIGLWAIVFHVTLFSVFQRCVKSATQIPYFILSLHRNSKCTKVFDTPTDHYHAVCWSETRIHNTTLFRNFRVEDTYNTKFKSKKVVKLSSILAYIQAPPRTVTWSRLDDYMQE